MGKETKQTDEIIEQIVFWIKKGRYEKAKRLIDLIELRYGING